MATIERFEQIISWQEARVLNKNLGDLIDQGRLKKNFKLIGQIEGSAGSIMDNIAEGFERGGNKEFVQFLYVAKGSCGELQRKGSSTRIEHNLLNLLNLLNFLNEQNEQNRNKKIITYYQ